MALKGVKVGGTAYQFDYTHLANRPRVSSVSLGATWDGSGPWSQQVSIDGVTESTKVDLQPDQSMLSAMLDAGTTAMWATNDEGAITVWAMGAAPSTAMMVQCTLTEM